MKWTIETNNIIIEGLKPFMDINKIKFDDYDVTYKNQILDINQQFLNYEIVADSLLILKSKKL